MAKRDENDFVQPKDVDEWRNAPPQDVVMKDKQLVDTPGPLWGREPHFGAETFVSRPAGQVVPSVPPPTQAEWLLQAKEAEAVILRGDIVSTQLIMQLFIDSVPVVEAAVPVSARRKRNGGDDERDEKAEKQALKDERAAEKRERDDLRP